MPDTLVWRNRLGYNEQMVLNYLRHPAYKDYPVVGVNWIQANEFCKWRTNALNQNILEKEKPQTGLNNFGDVNIGNPFANRLSVLFSEKEIQQIRQSGALELFEQRRDELQNLA